MVTPIPPLYPHQILGSLALRRLAAGPSLRVRLRGTPVVVVLVRRMGAPALVAFDARALLDRRRDLVGVKVPVLRRAATAWWVAPVHFVLPAVVTVPVVVGVGPPVLVRRLAWFQ